MSSNSVRGIADGEKVLVFNSDNGRLIDVCKCIDPTKREVWVKGRGGFSLATGKSLHGGFKYIQRGTPEQIQRAEQQLQKEQDDHEREEVAARQAAYDALPETVKLARKVIWLCGCHGEDVIAQAPVTALREIVAWAETTGREVG